MKLNNYKVIQDYFLGKCLCIPVSELDRIHDEYIRYEDAEIQSHRDRIYLNKQLTPRGQVYAALRHFVGDLVKAAQEKEVKFPLHQFKKGDIIVSIHRDDIVYQILEIEMNEQDMLDYKAKCLYSPYLGRVTNLTAAVADQNFVKVEEQ